MAKLFRKFFDTIFAPSSCPSRRCSPDSEQMKYESQEPKKTVSQVSHAQSNSVLRHEGTSSEMRKVADALSELAQNFQGRNR